MKINVKNNSENRLLIRYCHVCLGINESYRELTKCDKCQKSFLPLHYFTKIHDQTTKYDDLFCESNELNEEDLVKGIFVLW